MPPEPPSIPAGPESADRLLDEMMSFLRGGPMPDPPGVPAPGPTPPAPRPGTATWGAGGETADPAGRATPPPGEGDTDPGRVIGPYRIVAEVDRGGMGVVYQARHLHLPGRVVALKTIRAGLDSRAGMRHRFRTEAAAVARLDHPNIVRIYDFDEDAGELYYAMEWAPGGNLARRTRSGPMEPREAAGLVRDLARAMAFAHRNKVLHRDLKPNNVLLAADGRPKVADFGLARLLDDEATRLTADDAVMGTPAYMAPEQAAGRVPEIDARTDVYALGAILYELITGGPPFTAETRFETLAKVRGEAPARPSSVRPGLPRDLETVCLRCLEKDRADRYQSAEALAADLDHVLAGEPLADRPWTRVRKAVRFARRWRWAGAAAAGVVAACAVTVLVAAAYWRAPAAPNGESAAAREELEATLRAGRPAEVVGPTGWPKWFRWRAGSAADRRVFLGRDGVLSVESEHNTNAARLELLPDPMTDRYRVTAELRHDWSKAGGEVGVYVANHTLPRPRESQLFTALKFNGVVETRAMVALWSGGKGPGKALVEPGTAAVELDATLTAVRPDTQPFWTEITAVSGSRQKTRGTRSGHWYSINLTVTPDNLIAVLDGDRMTLSAEKLRQMMPTALNRLREYFPADTGMVGFTPGYPLRGSLGVYLYLGGVALRNVTVTPIHD